MKILAPSVRVGDIITAYRHAHDPQWSNYPDFPAVCIALLESDGGLGDYEVVTTTGEIPVSSNVYLRVIRHA